MRAEWARLCTRFVPASKAEPARRSGPLPPLSFGSSRRRWLFVRAGQQQGTHGPSAPGTTARGSSLSRDQIVSARGRRRKRLGKWEHALLTEKPTQNGRVIGPDLERVEDFRQG